MRSFQIVPNEDGSPQQFNALRNDAHGSSFLLAQQLLGYFTLSTNPTNGKTLTITINGTAIVLTGTTGTPANPGDFKIKGTAALTVAVILAGLQQPQTTTADFIALSGADQQLISYLSFAAPSGGTTLFVMSNNTNLYAPLASFSASTDATSDSFTAQAMQLYVHSGTVYVGGTRVLWIGGATPTVTAPASHPRIDVLAIDNTGTLSWTTGTEASLPTAPTYPVNKVPICELYNVVGETALYDFDDQQSGQGYIYNDVRPMIGTAVNLGEVTQDIVPDGSGTRNLGSALLPFGTLYADAISGAAIVAYEYQSFTSSGTWTKPAGLSGTEIVIVQMWGGGGAGGGFASTTGKTGGGGGGAYLEGKFRASDLGSTVTVTVGAAVSGGTSNGAAGNNSSFGSLMTAYGGGGGGGAGCAGGGGGGILSAGGSSTSPTNGAGGDPLGGPTSSGGGASNFGGGSESGASVYGGGGGGVSGKGGPSVYGGGGGGAYNGASAAGGTSIFGGAGGASGADDQDGFAGTAPGGGGGGTNKTSGSATHNGGGGARGEVRVWVIT